ncbi:nuclease-related domain-containing protein [Alkalibacterium putridalgicola]|uniref:nuclease-related domain-containing protein n=1 Tax=Alkalibacterium putridalgicola TaxID=426703 RepID=UPI0034CD643F
MDGIVIGLVLLGILILKSSKKKYDQSGYKEISQHSYIEVYFDKGRLGEYRLYQELMKLDDNAKVLPNVYVPKKDGTTSEIDLLFIAKTGIYVFESKNYGGWIYGSEKRRYWTQTFPNKTKHSFYNPIMQNKGHIRALKAYMGIEDVYFHSIIIFGENATLKSEELWQASVPILKRHQLRKKLTRDYATLPVLLTEKDMDNIYVNLKPLAQVSGEIRDQHIARVKQKQIKN